MFPSTVVVVVFLRLASLSERTSLHPEREREHQNSNTVGYFSPSFSLLNQRTPKYQPAASRNNEKCTLFHQNTHKHVSLFHHGPNAGCIQLIVRIREEEEVITTTTTKKINNLLEEEQRRRTTTTTNKEVKYNPTK